MATATLAWAEVTVRVEPTAAEVVPGQKCRFRARVTGAEHKNLCHWVALVNGKAVAGGQDLQDGTFEFTAPEAAEARSFIIRAASRIAPEVFATASLAVIPRKSTLPAPRALDSRLPEVREPIQVFHGREAKEDTTDASTETKAPSKEQFEYNTDQTTHGLINSILNKGYGYKSIAEQLASGGTFHLVGSETLEKVVWPSMKRLADTQAKSVAGRALARAEDRKRYPQGATMAHLIM